MRNRRVLGIVAAAALLPGAGAPLLVGQSRSPNARLTRTEDLATGKFLVARRGLLDPNFESTVVLLVQFDEEGVVGLVINRRTEVSLSEAFPKLNGTKGRPDTVYLGGPVGKTAALALVRSSTKPKDAGHVLSDIYLTASQTTMENTLAAGSPLHVYVGYGGWTAAQLRREVELGGWFIFPGDAATVFDAHPESVWSRWILKTEGQIAWKRNLYAPALFLMRNR